MKRSHHALVERDPEPTLSFRAVLLSALAMVVALVVMFALSGCSAAPPSTPAPAPAPVLETSACAKACIHQRDLGCELGTPTPAGAPCEEVCEDNAKHGFSWNTGCLAEAASCADECP